MRKTKKLLSVLLAVIVAFAALPVLPFTATAETEGLITYTVSNGKATVTGITDSSYSGELIIPSTLGGYAVTSIGSYAFSGCTGLTSITIPDSVTSIGEDAFSGCTGLESITVDSNNTVYHSAGNCLIETHSKTLIAGCKNSIIPDDGSVTSIGDWAFMLCYVTSITIPDSVTSIGGSAFEGCTGLTSITIPDSVTSIGINAFYSCIGLTSITIPDSVISIGHDAFWNCYGLTSVTIGNGVTSIDEYAFWGCTGLTSITIPDSVTSIGAGAFGYCTGLTSITIPDSVTSIGNDAFDDTAWYNNQPDGLVYAGKVAYKYKGTCPESVTIKDGTLGIAGRAFYNCTGLTSITIPDSVTSIGGLAFYGCTGLESITVDSNNTVYHSAGNCLIETHSKTLIAGCKNSIIPADGSVTSIGGSAFYGCSSLTSITIPDSVTSIDSYAFYGTAWYNNQPDGLVYAGKVAYKYKGTCHASITIKEGTLGIAGEAFYRCTGLICITIPDSVTSIGKGAFYHCTSLSDVYYTGTESQKNAINIVDINGYNDSLLNANWHYNYILLCEHLNTEFRNYIDATCTKAGHTSDTYCLDCGEKIATGRTIPAYGHLFGEWALTKAATCTEKGIETRVCIRDYDHTETREINALGHDYKAVITAPTCTEQGYTTHTCSRCGDSYVDSYTQALDHPHTVLENKVDATCTASGYSGDTYCYDCNTYLSYGSVIPALGHDYIGVITAPTCMHGGYTTYTCSRCGDSYVDEYTAPTGHKCDDWTVTKNATCKVEGHRIGNCKFCGIEMEEVIPTISHAYDAWRYEILPTCDAAGKIICTCLLCGDKKTITIDALGHEYSSAWTIDSEPTCTAAGHKSHHCIRCDAVSDDTEIPATGHSYTDVTVAPTCTKGGYTSHVCSVCGSSYKTDIVSATGHNFTHTAAKAPTCTEIGWGEYDTCDVCGYTTYEEIDALGHDYRETSTGYECSRCDAVIENSSHEEHRYVKTIVKPTAQADGYTQYTCRDCGYYYRTDETHYQTGAKFAVSNMVVGSGKKVILTVSISGNPGIYSFTLDVNYDKSSMTLSSVNDLGKLGGNLSLGVDKVLWLNNSHTNSTFNGDIFQLVFDVSPYATAQDYDVSLGYNAGNIANYSLDDVNFALESGVITVEGFTAGDINGDGACNNKDLIIMSEVFARNYAAYKKGKAHTEANKIKGFNLFGTIGMNILKDVDIVVLGVSIERAALDVDNDGIINNYDLLTLMKYLRGEEVEIL